MLLLKIRTLMEERKCATEIVDPNLVENLNLLTVEVSKDLSQRILSEDKEETFSKACLINRTLAFFLQDLVSCINASHVFRFIRSYILEVGSFGRS